MEQAQLMENPFVTNGYAGPAYFCDRVQETADITSLLMNGNDIALISPRRYGKTDLLRHCFAQERIQLEAYTFIIDIYSTKSKSDLAQAMGRAILDVLKPKGRKTWEGFINLLQSVRAFFTFDSNGEPVWSLGLGDLQNPDTTLDEIFRYLKTADKRCFVAIDEFQQIQKYNDPTIEAAIRTLTQYCSNANFVFSGSQREMMGSMFTSPGRPFYQSATLYNLKPIDKEKYIQFCQEKFNDYGKAVDGEAAAFVYDMFEGCTFFMQKVMNVAFMRAVPDKVATVSDMDAALNYILDFSSDTYEELLYQIPEKQMKLLQAIALEGKVNNLTSGHFSRKYNITASAAQAAVKGLMEKGLVTYERGSYRLYDYFLQIWLVRRAR